VFRTRIWASISMLLFGNMLFQNVLLLFGGVAFVGSLLVMLGLPQVILGRRGERRMANGTVSGDLPVRSEQRVYPWLKRVDEMIAERDDITDHSAAIAWSRRTIESLERLLGSTELAEEIKRSFAKLGEEIHGATGRKGRIPVLDRAVQLLRDYRTKVTAIDLR